MTRSTRSPPTTCHRADDTGGDATDDPGATADDGGGTDEAEPTNDGDGDGDASGDASGEGEPTDAPSGGGIDGSGIDWATVDATTIDWANIDFSTIDFAALEENPTLANLDEVTIAVIRQRYADEIAAGGGDAGSGEATLTIGDNTWNFEGFICAWGYQNTQSEVFSFSSNAFGTLDDGTRTQVQADIWDDTGSNSLTGPDTSHEVTFDDIDNFDDPAVNWSLSEPELTIDGMTVSVEGMFRDVDTGEEQPGSFVGECGPGSRF
jgi:hypothetical protein